MKNAIVMYLRRWLLVERDLQAVQIARASEMERIASELVKLIEKMQEVARTNKAQYASLIPLVTQVQNLERRLNFYTKESTVLSYADEKLKRQIEQELKDHPPS